MALRFYNTLTQQVEPFQTLDGNTVRMYTCGPTVYNYAHIGNLRTFTFEDILRRWLHLSRLQNGPRDEHHRRGRQDHSQRGRRGEDPGRVHGEVHRGVPRRHGGAAPATAGTHGESHRAYSGNGGRYREAGCARVHLRERRVHLLSDREISGIRQTLAQRFHRHSGRRAR